MHQITNLNAYLHVFVCAVQITSMLCMHELHCSAVARMQVNKTLSVELHFLGVHMPQ